MDYRGRTPKKLGLEWGDGHIPALSAANVRMGYIDFDQECNFASENLYRHWMVHGDVEKDDVVFTTEAPLGNVALIPDHQRYVLSQRTVLLQTHRQTTHSPFLYHVLMSEPFQRSLQDNASGSTAQGIKRKVFETLPLVSPPINEQEAIAEALSDADALIESLEQLITKKRHIKQGVMQELLTGKRRLPGFSGEWEVKRLEDVANIQRGASPRPIDSPIWFDNNSNVGWVRISDVTPAAIFLRETSQRLSALGVQQSRPVKRGSLIMSICATVGRPVITDIDTCIHDGFVVFDNLNVNRQFLYYFLRFIEGDWAKHGQTGSQMNLNTPLINQTLMPQPSNSEQTAIATILSDMDAELAELETRLAKAHQIKQGMMQELLTGSIRLL